MSKELEAFEQIKKYLVNLQFHFLEEELDIVESALKEVNGEDRAFLKHIKNGKLHPLTTKCYQNLLKKEKVLEIIKEKVIPYSVINRGMIERAFEEGWITKEEYDLLKEVLL